MEYIMWGIVCLGGAIVAFAFGWFVLGPLVIS